MRQLTDTEVQESLSLYGDCSNSTIFRAASKKQFQADCKDLLAKPTQPVRKFEFDDDGQGQLSYFIGVLFTEKEYEELKGRGSQTNEAELKALIEETCRQMITASAYNNLDDKAFDAYIESILNLMRQELPEFSRR